MKQTTTNTIDETTAKQMFDTHMKQMNANIPIKEYTITFALRVKETSK